MTAWARDARKRDERHWGEVMSDWHRTDVEEAIWLNFRDDLERTLKDIPDLYVEPTLEWKSTRGETVIPGPRGRPMQSTQRTKHIVRMMPDQSPTVRDWLNGNFVADIYLNDFIDRGVDHYKQEAMHPEIGDAIMRLMVDAPTTIRRLLTRIDELEERVAELENPEWAARRRAHGLPLVTRAPF